ncbi:integrase [Psychrobacillus sp. FJAT-51614]|uniref:Integrase n=1 Tax=Psychrobacillus mangrovi TaxID=3117745 RepID=A0ABU8F303_9BACI
MNHKYTEKNLCELINATMQSVGMNVPLKQDNSGVNMSYNFIGDYVGFDAERLIKAKEEMQKTISLELYIKTITMHELGHAIDRKALLATLDRTMEIFDAKRNHSLYELYNSVDLLSMIIEEHEMNIIFEETAWENAQKLNQEFQVVDEECFEAIKKYSLGTYREIYQEDLYLYEKLVAEHAIQIA